jgi:hypothetical protein
MIRLRLGQVAAVAAAVVLGPVVAHSQDYPNRTVTIVAPAAPGGLYSLFARLVGARLEQRFGKTFVVLSRSSMASFASSAMIATCGTNSSAWASFRSNLRRRTG